MLLSILFKCLLGGLEVVFRNESWNNTGDIVVYSNYHKYWLDRERHIKNPLFDVFSGKILDLKEGKESAVEYFFNLIDCEICQDVTICVVPSSNADNTMTGMTLLRERLARNGRIDKVHFIVRERSIEKLATGGDRSKRIHMDSLGTLTGVDVLNDVILLMDDVTTTGNSLYACKEILLAAGAKNVEMFALGKAI